MCLNHIISSSCSFIGAIFVSPHYSIPKGEIQAEVASGIPVMKIMVCGCVLPF
jgi:hypothetical protein